MHALFEFTPFLSGLLVGTLLRFLTASHRLHPWAIAWTSLLIGGVWSLLVGEITDDIATSTLCIVWDSSVAGVGAVAAHLFFRRVRS